jgi:hypothetical protein
MRNAGHRRLLVCPEARTISVRPNLPHQLVRRPTSGSVAGHVGTLYRRVSVVITDIEMMNF